MGYEISESVRNMKVSTKFEPEESVYVVVKDIHTFYMGDAYHVKNVCYIEKVRIHSVVIKASKHSTEIQYRMYWLPHRLFCEENIFYYEDEAIKRKKQIEESTKGL